MKYYLWVLGCSMNFSDAERIATVMDLLGYNKTEKEEEADVTITVACSVRQKAIDRIYGKVKGWNKKRAKNPNFKTILSGCVLAEDRQKMENSFDLIFEIANIEELVNFLSPNKSIGRIGGDYLSLLPSHESSFRAFVPIMTGCNNFCSYCAVPYTRGREKSRPSKEIIKEVMDLVQKGYKEIHFLGQNVNSYTGGSAEGSLLAQGETLGRGKFAELLQEIDAIPGKWRGYFYSNHPKDFTNELIEVIAKLKHFPHYIHLPLQSGNDQILRDMNRCYTQAQYLKLVKKIRKAMSDVVLTTDIIVGYPGEEESEFADTLKVAKEAKFEMIFIGRYSPRPGAKSVKLKDTVSSETKRERYKALTKITRDRLEKVNSKFVGQKIKVLVDENKSNKYFARTAGYKVVEIIPRPFKTKKEKIEIGQFIDVVITDSSAWKLFAEII